MLFELGWSNPLGRLPLPPLRLTLPILAGEQEEYDVTVRCKGDGIGVAAKDAQLLFQFTTERYQR